VFYFSLAIRFKERWDMSSDGSMASPVYAKAAGNVNWRLDKQPKKIY
jgi:hypothetical protein